MSRLRSATPGTGGIAIMKPCPLDFARRPSTASAKQCNSNNIGAGTAPAQTTRGSVPARRPVTRRIMNDVADGLLLDVREISITDLEFTDAESALSRALERILASKPERSFAGFKNFIS